VIKLKTPRTIHQFTGYLILALVMIMALQLPETSAQENIRTDNEDADSVQRDTANGAESGRGRDFGGPGYGPERWNRQGNFFGGFRGDRERSVAPVYFLARDFQSQPIDEGFVFVNGEFLTRPYTFRSTGEQTFVNDVLIAEVLVDVSSMLMFDDGEGSSQFPGRRFSRSQRTFAEFVSALFGKSRFVIVAFSGRPPRILEKSGGGNDLLCALVNAPDRAVLLPELAVIAGSSDVAAEWSNWITAFQPDKAFLEKAEPIVDGINAAITEGLARYAAIQRLERYSYPLTIAGMLMSVFAIGHLISNPPIGGKSPGEIETSPEVMQIVTRSLALVVALSIFDLVWTLLASQAGTMRELNPVGGRLIDDPAMLIVFKVAMTALAAGLIFKLRHYRRAQLASWWACLILTLLTVRWLTFSSLLA
jgi:hypothetical protein